MGNTRKKTKLYLKMLVKKGEGQGGKLTDG